jgi:hypothetical protein
VWLGARITLYVYNEYMKEVRKREKDMNVGGI